MQPSSCSPARPPARWRRITTTTTTARRTAAEARPARQGRTPAAAAPAGSGWSGGHARGYVDFDARYGHNHYYPSRGFVYGTLPLGAVSVGYGGGNYFFHGGVWFRPDAGRYVVVQTPVGIYLPLLPSDYATVWVGGVPYYYADGVYYNAAPGRGYVVVAPPPGAETAQAAPPPAPAPAAPDPIFYPRNNQSAAQTEADRRDCNAWATSQPKRWPTPRCSSAPPRPAWTAAATRCADAAARGGAMEKGSRGA